ncbi:MAG: Uma2 family endonuclease [Acidobacteriaceae bacterium]|nr:Uma2 family endonuclease [Acidobacteriaceae bacterium]
MLDFMSTVLTEPLYHSELIDGHEVQKPLPKKLHFLIEAFIIVTLARLLPKRFRVGPELNVLCGADRLVPDVSVVDRDARYINGDLADPAILCVEIVSPGQTIANLFDKADRLLRAGTPLCWIIWPERRKAWMYTADDLVEAADTLQALLPDGNTIQVSTAEMWAELDEPAPA